MKATKSGFTKFHCPHCKRFRSAIKKHSSERGFVIRRMNCRTCGRAFEIGKKSVKQKLFTFLGAK